VFVENMPVSLLPMKNSNMLQEVTFRVDYTAPNVGREFGTVYLGDKNVAYSIIAAGWARVKEQGPKGGEPSPYLTELLRLEEVAKQQGLGRWSKVSKSFCFCPLPLFLCTARDECFIVCFFMHVLFKLSGTWCC
jgi:hypothetical protein